MGAYKECIREGLIRVAFNPVDSKWVVEIEFDRQLSSGDGSMGCLADTPEGGIMRLFTVGSVEEYFDLLKKEAEEAYAAIPKGYVGDMVQDTSPTPDAHKSHGDYVQQLKAKRKRPPRS